MKSEKRILLLVPGFPVNEDDSICIPALQAIVRALNDNPEASFKYHVITFQYPFRKEEYIWNGIPVFSAGGSNKKFPLKLFTWWHVINYVLRLRKREQTDVVHSFWLHDCTWLGRWIARLTGARHIAMAMGQDVLPGNGYLKITSLKNTPVIANSPFSAKLLKQNYGINADAIIPIGILPRDFENINYHQERTIDLLNVGSLIPLKNQLLFIKIFDEIIRTFPLLTGVIIGSGVLEETLRNEIRKLGLEANLKLYPGLPRKKVLEMMAQSKILVHTSSYESAGYVLLEGLYSGMKVVSFKTGYLPEGESSFACDTTEEMKTTILELLSKKITYNRSEVPKISDTAKKISELYYQSLVNHD